MKNSDLYNRFNLVLFLSLILSMFTCFAINYIVDTYGLFNSPTFSKFNQIKPYKNSQIRLSKLLDIKRTNPDIIVLGSSRVMSGIEFNNTNVLNSRNSYNLGLPGAYMDELMYYVKYIINHNNKKPQKIIIGLDFFMFNENELDYAQKSFIKEIMQGSSPIVEIAKKSLSVDALVSSQKTVAQNISFQEDNQPTRESNTNFS